MHPMLVVNLVPEGRMGHGERKGVTLASLVLRKVCGKKAYGSRHDNVYHVNQWKMGHILSQCR